MCMGGSTPAPQKPTPLPPPTPPQEEVKPMKTADSKTQKERKKLGKAMLRIDSAGVTNQGSTRLNIPK
jgi:hypothetical protein